MNPYSLNHWRKYYSYILKRFSNRLSHFMFWSYVLRVFWHNHNWFSHTNDFNLSLRRCTLMPERWQHRQGGHRRLQRRLHLTTSHCLAANTLWSILFQYIPAKFWMIYWTKNDSPHSRLDHLGAFSTGKFTFPMFAPV